MPRRGAGPARWGAGRAEAPGRSPWCCRRRRAPGQLRPGRGGGRRPAGTSGEGAGGAGRGGQGLGAAAPPPPRARRQPQRGAGEGLRRRRRLRPSRPSPAALPVRAAPGKRAGLGWARLGSAALSCRGAGATPAPRCPDASWLGSARLGSPPPPRQPARPAGSKPALASFSLNSVFPLLDC